MSPSRRSLRLWAAALSAALALLTVLPTFTLAQAEGRRATVTTTDGRQLTGEFVSQDDKRVVLRIAGIETPIDRAAITGVEMLKTPAEEYAQRRAALADEDIDGRYALALWLFDQNELPLAQKELAALAVQAPQNQRVAMLANVVSERIKLQESAPAPAPAPGSTTSGSTATGNPASTPTMPATPAPGSAADPSSPAQEQTPADLPTAKLTDEQISMIKLFELPNDFANLSPKPSIVVPREVIEELIDKYRDDDRVPKGSKEQNELRRASPAEKLDLIFRLKAREFYPRVTVRTEAPALTAFKTKIHNNYVLSYCASNQCHGGTAGGNLFLFRSQPASEPTFYTNFYILHQYRSPQAFMIDREFPDRSLVIQYGLRRQDAKFPHPDVPGYHPEFRLPNDPRVAIMSQAIKDLYQPRPEYGIDFAIPSMKPSAPSTEPTPTIAPPAPVAAPAAGPAAPATKP